MANGAAGEELGLARTSYGEVLAATKHEDDKVGRFLTALAFLVAGALLFVQPDVLAAQYAVGSMSLPLPALALSGFLVAVLLALLLYVAAIAAPITMPPGRVRAEADDDPDPLVPSHLYFHSIAHETEDSWAALWTPTPTDLRSVLADEYRRETWNIAVRANNKRNRTVEASALFVAAIFFFGLTVGFAVDVFRRGPVLGNPGAGVGWDLTIRIGVAAWLSLFVVVTLYERLKRSRSRKPTDASLSGYWLLMLGAVMLILGFVVPAGMSFTPRATAAVLAGLGSLATVGGLAAVLRRREPRHAGVGSLAAAAVTALLVVAVAWWAPAPVQLLVAVFVALGPLVSQLYQSLVDARTLASSHRRNAA